MNQRNQGKRIYQPLNELKYNFMSFKKKEELNDLAKENYNIYQRLNAKCSSYTLNSHLRDYERAQYYKKNYCKYPSIDFYRTSKSNSFCSIFNYCTFNNYHNINNEFNNEYNRKRSNRTLHKTKSISQMFNINRLNRQRQEKINNIVKNHYELKHYYEDQNKGDEMEQNKEKEKEKDKKSIEYNENNIKDYDYDEEFRSNSKSGNDINNNNNKNKNENIIDNKNKIEKYENISKKESNNIKEDLVLLRDKLQYGNNEKRDDYQLKNDSQKNINNEKNQRERKDENFENKINKVENEVKKNEDDIVSDIMEDIDI